MTQDVEVLRMWIRIVLCIAALGSTSFPVLYLFSPWRSSPIGRLFMLQAVSFAVAMDLSLLFVFWRPESILVRFWINAIVLTAIAMSTILLTVTVARRQHRLGRLPKMLFTNSVYNKLKFVVQVLLPALATLYFTLSEIWNFPNTAGVMATLTGIAGFLGVLLRMSTKTFNESDHPLGKFDGTIVVTPGEEGATYKWSADPTALTEKDQVLLKITHAPEGSQGIHAL
jgi:hypothetical protein